MSYLSLFTLGSLRIELDGQTLERFRTNRVPALLIYMAVEDAFHGPQAHRRDKIMALLWPGLPEKSARANLRQNLYLLRKTIAPKPDQNKGDQEQGDFLLGDYQTLQINPDLTYDLDAAKLIDLLLATRTHAHLNLITCSSCQQHLQEAAALYKGPFLADFYLPDSDGFEDWAYEVRERLRCQVLDALETLTTIHIGQGNYAQAEVAARKQLDIDALNDNAYRQLMEIMARDGRRGEALAEYEKYRKLLVEELGMSPTAKTTALYEKIFSGDLDLTPTQDPGVRGYILHEQLGSGSYGSVYRASQPTVGRDVAIKVIQAHFANHPAFIRRFETEAQIVARLEHPHIVPLYDYWREPDGAYLVMRWLRGGSLQARLQNGPLEMTAAVTLVDQIGSALAAAHHQGIVHRDIKPANILLDEDDHAYLSDFGIAIDVEHRLEQPEKAFMPSSPKYISPEQVLNEPVTPLSDIYSFGLVLYELITGRHPFAEYPVDEMMSRHLREPIPPVQKQCDNIAPAVDAVIQRATAKQPADRYPDIMTLAAAFRNAVFSGDFNRQLVMAEAVTTDLVNPYKGLHAFQEADAAVFFGRKKFVDHLISRLATSQFLAIVGPSGSGKSSVARAGLIPAIRQGAIAGSENWFIAEMTPGDNPLQELGAALTQIAVDPPLSLLEPLRKDEHGLTRVLKRILPVGPEGKRSPLLLLIDQFEELFTLVEDQALRGHFLDILITAMDELRGQLRVIITLRADFYDRPLQFPPLAELLRQQTELLLPMTSAELEEAICSPAAGLGVVVEPQLAAAITADVQEQPGALPLLQYALTELFDRRQGSLMTMAAYETIGGVTGALSRRAEELYAALDADGQEATRQLFLRLVTLGEGVEDTRRRVPLSELDLLNLDIQDTNGQEETPAKGRAAHLPIINRYGQYRLLTFDRDPVSRAPTTEVAHESLLREWLRLRDWLDESRADVRRQRLLASATDEWLAAGRDEGFLLSGARLDQFSGWAENTTIALTHDEQNFLTASLSLRRSHLAAEETRRQRELQTAQKLADTERRRAEDQIKSNRRLRRRAFFLTAALLVAAILAVLAIAASRQANENELSAQANAELAVTREAEALTEAAQRATAESIAVFEREEAEAQTRQARARALAGAAVSNLQIDPELSVLLALQAIETTYNVDNEWVPEAVDALHQAVGTASRLQDVKIHSGGAMNHIVFSPDGSLLGASTLLAGQDVMTTVWRTSTGEELFTLDTSIMTFSTDNSRLITWRVDENLDLVYEIWDAENGEKLDQEYLTVDDIVNSIGGSISYDWRFLIIRYWYGTVDAWDISTKEKVLHLTEHEEMVESVEFSHDNQFIGSADITGQVKVWQAPVEGMDGVEEPASLLTLPHDGSVETFAFSPDSRFLATISNDYTASVWDLPASISSGEPILLSQFELTGHAERISQIVFNAQGSLLAAVSQDGLVRVWDVLTGSELLTLVSNKHTRRIAFSPNGKHLLTTNDGGLVQTWDITPAGEVEFLTLNDQEGVVNQIAYSPDGKQLATAGSDDQVKVWDSITGELLATLSAHDDKVRAVAFSTDGSRLASAGNDRTVKIWDWASGQELSTLDAFADLPLNPIPENNALDVAFSADGRQMFMTGMSPVPKIWDLKTGEAIMELNGHDYNVPALDLSPDGSRLATVGVEGQMIVWDSKTGEQLFVQPTSVYASWDVAFSPDGRSLATADGDGTVRVWDLDAPSGERLLLALSGHGAAVRSVAFSPDGRYLASASANLTRIWDAATGQPLYTLPGHKRVITDIEFSPDNIHLASSSADGTVRIYILPVTELMELARSRLTRSLTDEECRQYMQVDTCPN